MHDYTHPAALLSHPHARLIFLLLLSRAFSLSVCAMAPRFSLLSDVAVLILGRRRAPQSLSAVLVFRSTNHLLTCFQKDITAKRLIPQPNTMKSIEVSFSCKSVHFSPVLDQFSAASQHQTASACNSLLYTVETANRKTNAASKEAVEV